MPEDAGNYLPERERRGLGLCLSGGGYRATLFHAGALRRLAELGVLSGAGFRTVSSVSGGSIAAAFLATAFAWPLVRVPSKDEWDRHFAGPLRRLTRKNIRTGALLRSFLPRKSAVGELAKQYDAALGGPRPLSELPVQFVLCATDLAFGANWESTSRSVGSYQTGYVEPPPRGWTVGAAVAASSCFPPVFQPLKVSRNLGQWRRSYAQRESARAWAMAMEDLRLTDGGNYDNMGLEPVWKDHAVVLVSDAGGLFAFQSDEGLPWRVRRYQAVQEQQTRALRKRWLVANYIQGVMDGAYWSTGSARSRYDPNDASGYSKELAKELIAEIRTDLDAFSDAEAAVLENHGYYLADVAVKVHCREVATVPNAPLDPPHPEWAPGAVSEDRIRTALEDSHRRNNLGRR